MTRNEKNRSIALGVIVLLAIWYGAAPMCAAEPGQKTKIALTDLAKSAAATALARVDGRVEVVKTQKSAADGLQLTVIFRNDGEEAIRFLEPNDTTQVMLLDAEGWPIELPRVAPGALINKAGDQTDPKVVSLEPGQEYRLELVIREVLPRAAEGAQASRTPQPIRAGAYDLRVTSTLIAAEPDANGVRASRTFATPEAFTVHLGH